MIIPYTTKEERHIAFVKIGHRNNPIDFHCEHCRGTFLANSEDYGVSRVSSFDMRTDYWFCDCPWCGKRTKKQNEEITRERKMYEKTYPSYAPIDSFIRFRQSINRSFGVSDELRRWE